MHKKYYKLKSHLIKQWPEVLNDVCVSSMPLAYINSMKLGFSDGRIWEISFTAQDKNDIAEHVENLMEELEPEIVKVDFDLNVQQLKQDIQESTNKAI